MLTYAPNAHKQPLNPATSHYPNTSFALPLTHTSQTTTQYYRLFRVWWVIAAGIVVNDSRRYPITHQTGNSNIANELTEQHTRCPRPQHQSQITNNPSNRLAGLPHHLHSPRPELRSVLTS